MSVVRKGTKKNAQLVFFTFVQNQTRIKTNLTCFTIISMPTKLYCISTQYSHFIFIFTVAILRDKWVHKYLNWRLIWFSFGNIVNVLLYICHNYAGPDISHDVNDPPKINTLNLYFLSLLQIYFIFKQLFYEKWGISKLKKHHQKWFSDVSHES